MMHYFRIYLKTTYINSMSGHAKRIRFATLPYTVQLIPPVR